MHPLPVDQMNAPYRRFRAELRRSTTIDPIQLAHWLSRQGDRLVIAYEATGEDGSILDFEIFIRQQYIRARKAYSGVSQ